MLQQQQEEEQHRARNNCKVLPRSVCDKCNSWRSRENERKKRGKQRKTPRVASSFCTLATRRRINVHELKFVNLCVCVWAPNVSSICTTLKLGFILHPSGFCAMAISCYDCEMSSSWEELIKMLFIVVEKCHPNSSPFSSLSLSLFSLTCPVFTSSCFECALRGR